MTTAQPGVAIKGEITIRKWAPGRDPEVDPPDDITVAAQWQEDGEVVTDPDRIAELERLANKKGQS